eukprot:scaffold1206_cov184-Ochromonas_danica.AAC.4
MSVVLKLPEDILHAVYSEWLEWKDLSMLDIACMKKNEREEWLTSLSDLKMTQPLATKYVFSNHAMKVFYKWLGNRRVFCVKGFVVMPDVLEDLAGGLLEMESYCPTLRSIDIYTWCSNYGNSDISQDESNLSVFLSHCRNLQGLTVRMDDTGYPKQLCDSILQVLVEKLRENSLVKISLQGILTRLDSHVMITNLLTKHASSLQYLNLCRTVGMDIVISTLLEKQIRLKVLSADIDCRHSERMASLISYISSAGCLLEDLKVECWSLNADDLVLSVSKSCPKLTRFCCGGPCSTRNLRQLFEQCPYLQYVSIEGTMKTYEENMSVTIEVKGSDDDWAVCLTHALKRRQYKQVTLRLREVYHYHPVRSLMSILKPCQIRVENSVSEVILISLLQDLPHLNRLDLYQAINNQYYTDATLLAIKDHAKSLTELFVTSDYSVVSGRCFSDKLLSELIKNCRLLKRLTIYGCGWESLQAISSHFSLMTVRLTMSERVSEEMLDGLLLHEKIQGTAWEWCCGLWGNPIRSLRTKWSSTLEEGNVRSYNNSISYKFNKESSHDWIKHARS